MKNKLGFLITVLSVFLILTACGNVTGNDENRLSNDPYEILLYKYGEGAAPQASTEKYNGKELITSNKTTKTKTENKKVSVFGYEHELFYSHTLEFSSYDGVYDEYDAKDGLFMLDEETERIVSYDSYTNKTGDDYKSPVNAHSSRLEFIDYARSILLEYTGVSTEDCDVLIKTVKLNTTYKYSKEETEQDFVNFVEQDPDFSAEYRITFKRKLDSVYRADLIEVVIESGGDVISFKCMTSDKKYEPYLNTKIDKERIIKEAEEAFKLDVSDYDVTSHSITLTAIPDGDGLWVRADVNYKYNSNGEMLGGMLQYITIVTGKSVESAETVI